MVDLEIIQINNEQIEEARALASKFSTADLRKKGMMDMLGIFCAKRFLSLQNIKTDTSKSIYKIPVLYEEFKVTDLYHLGYRIDVITLYKEKSVKIPKIHVDMDILPDFYFIVQIGAKIKEAKTIGFIESKVVLSSPHDSRFYYPTIENIFDIEKFRSLTKMPALKHAVPAKHKECMELFLKFIDNELPSVYKRQMIRHLLDCPSCLQRFADATEFEKLSKNIENYPELIKKYEIRSASPAYKGQNNAQRKQGDYLPLKSLSDEFEEVKDEEEMEIEYRTHSQEGESANFKRRAAKRNEDNSNITNDKIARSNTVKKYIKEIVEETVRGTLNSQVKKVPQNVNKKNVTKETKAPKQNVKKPLKKEEVIGEIFDESKEIALPSKINILKMGRKRLIIASSIMFVILMILSIVAYKGSQSIAYRNDDIPLEEQGYEDEYTEDDYNDSQAKLISRGTKLEEFSLKKPTPNKNAYNPTISKVSWEAPESLVKNEEYTKFLQATGKNIKLNLQNELLLVNDIPINKEVRADIKLANQGDIISIKFIQSSGSELIDLSIKRVIEDTLKYIKPPSTGIISKPNLITLTVNLN